jgi:hypothetical protein
MTRLEWKNHWRQLRESKSKEEISTGTMVAVLKERYDYIYTPKQEAFIRLACRYKTKLPKSYQDKIESWKPEARRLGSERLKSLIYGKNPFLDLLPKDDEFKGKYVPIPIMYGSDE